MFRSTREPGRDSLARSRGIGEPGGRTAAPGRSRPTTHARRRHQRLSGEALEGRQMLSGFYIVNLDSGLALDDTGWSTGNGNLMQQWQPTGQVNQQWDLVSLADGNYEIANAYSGKVLDDTNWSTSNGTPIQQWQYCGGLNQQWKIISLGNGNDQAIVNAYSGKALDDTNASTSDGTTMQQWQYWGGLNQQWAIIAAGHAPGATNYVTNAASGLVLDNPEFSTSNGTRIQQYHLDEGSNQQWVFVSLADGDDLIVNQCSGKVLEDPGSSTSDHTLIQQDTLNGGLNQQWQLVAQADGNDEIVNACSGKALDDPSSSTSGGTLIQQYQLNGGLNQQWSISAFASPVSSKPYSPASAYIPLFHNGAPSSLDVTQGQVGDCWLLASLAEVAARDPQVIESMFTYDGSTVDNGAGVNLYTVRFYNGGGSAVYVNVDTELPLGGAWYDDLTSQMGTQALWVALAEKAYAEANALGAVTTGAGGMDSYNAMNGGDPAWALQAITGRGASDLSISFGMDPVILSGELAAAWNAGALITLCTSSPSSSEIVGDHCYAVVGYNAASGGTFEIFNPWGSNSLGWAAAPGKTSKILGQFWANAGFIEANFTSQGLGAGTADGDAIDRALDELTELSALGGDFDPSGMIHAARRRITGGAVGASSALGSPPAVPGNEAPPERGRSGNIAAFEIKDPSFGAENPTTIGSATGGAGAGKIKFNG